MRVPARTGEGVGKRIAEQDRMLGEHPAAGRDVQQRVAVLGCHYVEAIMNNLFARFVRDESGATAIEYGLIAALIAVVIIGAVQVVGTNLSTTFTTVSGKIK